MKTSKTGPRLKKPGGEGLLRASPFLLPSLIGLAIFYLAPMVVSIFISLTDWNSGAGGMERRSDVLYLERGEIPTETGRSCAPI